MLYQKYTELVQIGQFEGMLEELYEEGRALNFRVPMQPAKVDNASVPLSGDGSLS